MDILFHGRKMQRDCSCLRDAVKGWGDEGGRLIMLRLDQLRAAETLEVMKSLPRARCHEMTGDRQGQLSVDLKHPYRLFFKPAMGPVPQKGDGGLDWSGVTAIMILEVDDPHD